MQERKRESPELPLKLDPILIFELTFFLKTSPPYLWTLAKLCQVSPHQEVGSGVIDFKHISSLIFHFLFHKIRITYIHGPCKTNENMRKDFCKL